MGLLDPHLLTIRRRRVRSYALIKHFFCCFQKKTFLYQRLAAAENSSATSSVGIVRGAVSSLKLGILRFYRRIEPLGRLVVRNEAMISVKPPHEHRSGYAANC
jgi:hypothetical protein